MSLRYYKNTRTGEEKRSLKVLTGEWKEIIKAPGHKCMITSDKATGKSKVKDLTKTLTKRARQHSRDVELTDQMQIAIENDLEATAAKSLLNSKGEKRRQIDDI